MMNVFCVATYITQEILKLSGYLKPTDLRNNISLNIVLSLESSWNLTWLDKFVT